MTYQVQFYQNLDWQHQADWQAPDTPFMQFAYWQALLDSQAIGEGSDWVTLFAVVQANEIANNTTDNTVLAALPIFIKDHHQGEYVFDHAWAQAYDRYGIDYYPRLVTSVPFTPVTGERVWLAKGTTMTQQLWQVMSQAVDEIAGQIKASTWHGLFVSDKLVKLDNDEHLLRLGCQFRWFNRDKTGNKFSQFDDFLATLTAKKRKSIKVERQKIAKQGLTCQIKLGEQLSEDDWQIFYQCYAMTYLVRGRQPYLTLGFFEQIGNTMCHNLMLAQAVDSQGAIVACALFFYDDTTLYGRYWGCLADYDSLHFELCYYQGIAFAIEQGLHEFDPGTQGEHKLIRGFMPTLSYSLHRVYHKGFEPAIANYCQQEHRGILRYYDEAMTAVPFNQDYLEALAAACPLPLDK